MHPLIKTIQSVLAFDNVCSPHFASTTSLGRIALLSSILSLLLGFALSALLFTSPSLHPQRFSFSLYTASLTLFHLSEFFTTCTYNPQVVSSESFLVNHSEAYTLAALLSWLEFGAKVAVLPAKLVYFPPLPITAIGGLLTFGGMFVRIFAMVQCGKNFNHTIQASKKNNHELVTDGIYTYLRHPSYFGWFFWSIGTQILLGNILCFVGYFAASWDFFRKRIPYEERLLVNMYGDEYRKFMSTTPIMIPFVRGSEMGVIEGDKSKNEKSS